MNHFQLNYIERLQYWSKLRNDLFNKSLETQCVEIDRWWQKAPLINHYLHPHDVTNYPNPWELLSDNEYCPLARGLGMCYTMALVNDSSIELLIAIDSYGNDAYIVSVDCGKYILNYHPDSVLNTSLQDFSIKSNIDISHLLKKLK